MHQKRFGGRAYSFPKRRARTVRETSTIRSRPARLLRGDQREPSTREKMHPTVWTRGATPSGAASYIRSFRHPPTKASGNMRKQIHLLVHTNMQPTSASSIVQTIVSRHLLRCTLGYRPGVAKTFKYARVGVKCATNPPKPSLLSFPLSTRLTRGNEQTPRLFPIRHFVGPPTGTWGDLWAEVWRRVCVREIFARWLGKGNKQI
jgi:hypothetical protein